MARLIMQTGVGFFMFFVVASAQETNISGTVKNTLGQPVENAGVTLKARKMSTFTDSLGRYSFISQGTAGIASRHLQYREGLRYEKGFLSFDLPVSDRVTVSLFNLAGRQVRLIADRDFPAGSHHLQVRVPTQSAGIYILRFSTKRLVRILKLTGSNHSALRTALPYASYKTAAVAAAIDSMQALAVGYEPKTVQVSAYTGTVDITLSPLPAYTGTALIDTIYFAQNHVLPPGNPLFRLTGNRKTLIKVHMVSPARSPAPQVVAELSVKDRTLPLVLTGPAVLPVSFVKDIGKVQHSYSDAFCGFIPAEWVTQGLAVTVKAGGKTRAINNLPIGAPTTVVMNMIDVNYFVNTGGDFQQGTINDLEAVWPVADLELRRLRGTVFKKLIIPPRSDVGAKAACISSPAEYKTITGQPFDGEQAAALKWVGALKAAAGTSGRHSLYYIPIYGANAGGQAGGFSGVGNGTSAGILCHELGHALSLGDCYHFSTEYPYYGTMYGIAPPAGTNDLHAGPTWKFDLNREAFIPPTVQPDHVPDARSIVGTWKRDPMCGGGSGDQETGYSMRQFSDWSVKKIQSFLESHVVVWNDKLQSWAGWNQATFDYSIKVSNNGVQFPIVRDTQVISVMAGISSVTPQATLVYPPIGPYKAGLIRLFDAAVAADRTAAQSMYCPSGGCDVCVKVTQGGNVKTYMLPIDLDKGLDPLSDNSFKTRAINLPSGAGSVTRVELLSTPDVEDNGLPASPAVLSTWVGGQ